MNDFDFDDDVSEPNQEPKAPLPAPKDSTQEDVDGEEWIPEHGLDALEARVLMSATWIDADTGDEMVDATAGDDIYIGDALDNEAHAGDGDDILFGHSGDDSLFGDAGADTLIGGSGLDSLMGGAGDDWLDGGSGADVLSGSAGDDTILGAGVGTPQLTEAVEGFNPIAHWSLGSGDGTGVDRVVDSAGDHEGTLEGGATTDAIGTLGGDLSADFDGVDDFIEVPHSADLELDSGTLQMWFQPDDTSGTQGLFSKDSMNFDDGGHLAAYLDNDTLVVRLQSVDASHSVSVSGVTASEWHHLAFTFGDGGMNLYLDGVLADTNAYTGGLDTSSGGTGNTEPLVFGASTMHSADGTTAGVRDFFDGQLDEIALHGTSLDLAAVQSIYAAGSSPTPVTSDSDTIDGGTGVDTVDYSQAAQGVSVDLGAGTATSGTDTDTLTNIENVISGSGSDSLTGSDADNVLDAGAGDDTVSGGDGSD